ncbi:hypothetical protein [Pseudomonas sp.]|uniref:hypothetical protein n=1 Tax=Pseudomonas sp. TaxID=306 RepID=UPI0019D8D849|nr:hypothetical protein [Pseudomonas sp.]MBF0674796.1 hypothetical protein [Pseudomonas sp.]
MAERDKLTLGQRLSTRATSFWRRWRALEKRQLARVRARGGRLFVRCAFRLGDLLILSGVLLISGWVLLPVLLLAGFVHLIARTLTIDPWPESPTYDQVDHPDHRAQWPERYDEWGNLK